MRAVATITLATCYAYTDNCRYRGGAGGLHVYNIDLLQHDPRLDDLLRVCDSDQRHRPALGQLLQRMEHALSVNKNLPVLRICLVLLLLC